ncbi:CD276 antigen homolog [Amia ocellicauda]|uniref:CD276 antigen homolog n=1 Tax=Amia ocellicauda TaxID=2972642 RepID=UPI003463E27B
MRIMPGKQHTWSYWGIIAVFSLFLVFGKAGSLTHIQTITGIINQSAVLPCSYKTDQPFNLTKLRIYWQISHIVSVHVFNHGQVDFEHQVKEYENRTSFFLEELTNGNFSLRISPVKFKDKSKPNEKYDLYFENENGGMTHHCAIEFHVAASFNEPVLNISACENIAEGIKAICTAQGGYPEPRVNWTVQGGLLDPKKIKTNFSQDPKSGVIFVTSIAVITNISEQGTVRCSIINEKLGEIKTSPTEKCNIENHRKKRDVPSIIGVVSVLSFLGLIALIIYCKTRTSMTAMQETEQSPNAGIVELVNNPAMETHALMT